MDGNAQQRETQSSSSSSSSSWVDRRKGGITTGEAEKRQRKQWEWDERRRQEEEVKARSVDARSTLGGGDVDRMSGDEEKCWRSLTRLLCTRRAILLLSNKTITTRAHENLLDLALEHIILLAHPLKAAAEWKGPDGADGAYLKEMRGGGTVGKDGHEDGGGNGSVEFVSLSGLRGSWLRTMKPVAGGPLRPTNSLEVRSFLNKEDSPWIRGILHGDEMEAFVANLPPLPTACTSAPTYPRFALQGAPKSLGLRLAATSSEAQGGAMGPDEETAGSPTSVVGFDTSLRTKESRTLAPMSSLFKNRLDASFVEHDAKDGRLESGGSRENSLANTLAAPSPFLTPTTRPRSATSSSRTSSSSSSPALILSAPCKDEDASLTRDEKECTVHVALLQEEDALDFGRKSVLATLGADMRRRLSDELSRCEPVDASSSSSSSSSSSILPLLDREIVEVVVSFAAIFLPPTTSSSASEQLGTPLQPSVASHPSQPEELGESFQDLWESLTGQIDGMIIARGQTHLCTNEEAQRLEVQRLLDEVEHALCVEVYDRIFCPIHSADEAQNASLKQRIAALNVLGMNLAHLGLDVREDASFERHKGQAVRDALHDLTKRCGAVLCTLNDISCRAPKKKLDVLLAAHRLLVEGLEDLPRFRLKEDADADVVDGAKAEMIDAKTLQGEIQEPATLQTKDELGQAADARNRPSTSSTDLILPLLIHSIISTSPPQLAAHLLYVERFRPASLIRGESSYCLVNMQAAVTFLQNVQPETLGLQGADLIAFPKPNTSLSNGGAAQTASARVLSSPSAATPMPMRFRGRVAQEIGELAGMSNRVITGVMGSSISAFGRMMGSSPASAQQSPLALLSQSQSDARANVQDASHAFTTRQPSSGLTNSLRSFARVHDGSNRGAGSAAAASLQSVKDAWTGSAGSGGSDYGRDAFAMPSHSDARAVQPDVASSSSFSPPLAHPASSSPANGINLQAGDRMSFGHRLASIPVLNRLGLGSSPSLSSVALPSSSQQSTSPIKTTRELPGPPPPDKFAKRQGKSKSLATELSNSALAAPAQRASGPPINRSGSPEPYGSKIPASLQSPYPPLSRPPTSYRPLHVVLASTGSVASIKVPLIVDELLKHDNVRVQVVATSSSLHFFKASDIFHLNRASVPSVDDSKDEGKEELAKSERYSVQDLAAENRAAVRGTMPADADQPRAHVWTDVDEWDQWKRVGDPILHIELRRWADIVLVAPCSANTLAKITAGICDSLLTSFLRALSPTTPTVLFPAMNTLMYMHPLTAHQLALASTTLGYEVVGPISKMLACGDLGQGAMTEWTDIVQLVVRRFGLTRSRAALHE
ncbi:hypothetical protein IE81DRAFT_325135 [Ceraceosorus guamensis]|uniref:VPS9 domain-containing protein n=1 Tax=Ceraceosorus guamensis TaxID=1522189 RepID=A0A316VTF9_9BASI|nr:hypothetical protein IE81DRAFT_325135 [Ceraceosorus guamensis]PWN40876.1 hypothetical protein IE81DRAFT_325135 [Ceraceosorus guamensis]